MSIADKTVPPLEWPNLADEPARLAWFRAVIAAYADLWDGHVSAPRFKPADPAEVARTEQRIGCALPDSLRRYHLDMGALDLAESLCALEQDAATPIQPLFDAYPGLVERGLTREETALAEKLVVFGDYLGNGNMFSFHRDTGAVHYFDHDTDPALTLFAPDVNHYLEALMIKMLAEVHEQDDEAEDLLIQRFGRDLVRKWMY